MLPQGVSHSGGSTPHCRSPNPPSRFPTPAQTRRSRDEDLMRIRLRRSDFYVGELSELLDERVLERLVEHASGRLLPLLVIPIAGPGRRYRVVGDCEPRLRPVAKFDVVGC